MDQSKTPLVLAGDRIRETAKWLTVSLALLGGVLMAGTQLSSIGSLQPGSERFQVAVLGGAVAALGAGLILFGTVWTATSPAVRLAELKDKSDDKNLNDQVLLQGLPTVAALATQYETALSDRRTKAQQHFDRPVQETADLAEASDARVEYLDGIVRNVLQVASYYRLTDRWRRCAVIIAAGALIAAGGLSIFIWAANPAPAAKTSTASPSVIGEVSEQTIILLPGGKAALEKALGAACPISVPLKVTLLEKMPAGPDVIINHDGCKKARLILGTSWGTLQEPAAR